MKWEYQWQLLKKKGKKKTSQNAPEYTVITYASQKSSGTRVVESDIIHSFESGITKALHKPQKAHNDPHKFLLNIAEIFAKPKLQSKGLKSFNVLFTILKPEYKTEPESRKTKQNKK